MSRKKINLMRAVIHGLLAALAILSLGRLPEAVAESPKPTPAPKLTLLPAEHALQEKLMVVNPLALPMAMPRVVLLPERAPLPSAAAWQAHLNPASLMLAMRAALLPAPAPSPAPGPARLRLAEARPEARLAPAAARPAAAAAPRMSFPVPQPIASPVDLQLTMHHSLVVQSPVPLTRVSITDDAIAQAIVVSPTQVLVQGRSPGEVSLLLWDANASARAYTVRVGLDPGPLEGELARLFPHNRLHVSASGDALVVSGVMNNAASAKQALDVAAGFSKHVVNNLSLDAADDPGQVMLQVRFAEVDRSAVAQFGVNLLSTGAGNTVGSVSTQQFGGPAGAIVPSTSTTQPPGGTTLTGNPPGAGTGKFGLNNLLNVFLFRSDANLGATIQALQQQNLLQILAEPNLVAMDGKEASFLAGGEFPFPVVQGQGAVNNVTIQFKPFGVNLHFKPTILPDGTIDLQVAPEVSALDFSNALTVSGFLIPALSTRRAETELELADGQSFVIAGLMDNRLTKNMSKLPGLGDIPILGKLFQSWSTNKSRSELVVVVTAHLVHPSNTAAKGPRMPQPFLLPDKFDHAAGGHR